MSVVPAVDLEVAVFFFGVRADPLKLGRAVEAVNLVANRQFQRRVHIALFFVTAPMQILVIGGPRSSMDPGASKLIELANEHPASVEKFFRPLISHPLFESLQVGRIRA